MPHVGVLRGIGSAQVVGRGNLGGQGVNQRVVRAAGDRTIPEVLSTTAGVAVAAIKTVFVLGLQIRVTGRRSRRPWGLAFEDHGRGVLMAGVVLLQADPDWFFGVTPEGFDLLVLVFLNFLPAPHGLRRSCAVALDVCAAVRQGRFPGLVRSFECRGGLAATRVGHWRCGLPGAAGAVGQPESRSDGLKRVFGQGAVAGRAAAMVGLNKPIELPGVNRFVDQLFQ